MEAGLDASSFWNMNLMLIVWLWQLQSHGHLSGWRSSHTHHDVPVTLGRDARQRVVKRASLYNVLLLLKGELPTGRSAKSETHASLNWSHLLALDGVSTDKCLSAVLHFLSL
jgi:hypothetical protein